MTSPSSFPRPTPFIISQAVSSGLSIPAIQIDPRLNFVQGAFLFASDIDKLSMKFKTWRTPLMEARDTVIIPSIEKNFNEEGRPRWQALTPATIQNRLYMGFPRGPILNRTGRLRKIATRKNIWELVNAASSAGVDMLSLRTSYFDQLVPYAEFHQLGAGTRRGSRVFGSIKGSISSSGGFSGFKFRFNPARPELGQETRTFRMPPRPFIQLTVDEEVEIYGIFFNFMSNQVTKYWGPESKGREF